MSTTSKLGADMLNDELKSNPLFEALKLAVGMLSLHGYEDEAKKVVAEARLARQPAAIDKQCTCKGVLGHSRQCAMFDESMMSMSIAAPLDKESGKPAAPVGWRFNVGSSDDRIWLTVTTPYGATASLSCAGRNDNGRTIQGQVLMALQEALDAPAAIDKQEAVAICTICNGYGRYQDGNSGTEADGYAPNIVECECADEERRPEYRVAAPLATEASKPAAIDQSAEQDRIDAARWRYLRDHDSAMDAFIDEQIANGGDK